MKIFIATDVHGSAYWAEKILQKFNETNCDILMLLGDVYNHGPRNPFPQDYAPMKVAEIFNGISNKVVAVRGNCDSEVDQMISTFPFVQNNILYAFGRKLYFTHGHVFNKDNLPCLSAGDAMFYGHFHVNEVVDVQGVTCVNVGSCALPKDGISPYCIVDENGITLFNFDGGVVLSHKF